MRRALTLSLLSFILLFLGMAGNASADPIKSPRVGPGATLVCGDITYTVVLPPGPTPAGQIVTANGSNSTKRGDHDPRQGIGVPAGHVDALHVH
jgi:hypothetical protein